LKVQLHHHNKSNFAKPAYLLLVEVKRYRRKLLFLFHVALQVALMHLFICEQKVTRGGSTSMAADAIKSSRWVWCQTLQLGNHTYNPFL